MRKQQSNFVAKFLIFVVVLLMKVGTPAYAQTTATGNASVSQAPVAIVAIMEQVISEVVQSVEDSFNKLRNKAGFDEAGQTILWMLLAVMMAWAGVKSLTGQGLNSFLEETIILLLLMGIVQMFLWGGGISAIEGFIDGVAATIAGEDMSTLSSTLYSISRKSFNSIINVISMPAIESNSGFSISKILVYIPQLIMQILAKFIAAGFIVIAAAVYVANVVIAYGSIMIATALAPIMIPWLLLPATSFLFDGWLRFFLGACMFKVVGAFFVLLTNNWIEGITKISQNVKMDSSVDAFTLHAGNFVIYLAIIFMAGASAYLMIMVPSIASGLLSGSAARAGFSGMSTLTSGVGGRALGASTMGGMKGVSKAGGMAGKAGAKGAQMAAPKVAAAARSVGRAYKG